MARIRSIKPEFCSSADTGALSRDARLFFLQLLTEADDEGRLLWLPRRLCGLLYPHDEDVEPELLEQWAAECQRRSMLTIYRNSGVNYVQITNWSKHQRINRASESKLPSHSDAGSVIVQCGLTEGSLNSQGEVSEDVHREQGTGNREQGRGTGNRDSSLRSDSSPSLTLDGDPSPPADLKARKAARIHQIATEAQDAYNSILGKPNGLLTACTVLNRPRMKAVEKSLPTARIICQQIYGNERITQQFWQDYFREVKSDDFHSGRGPYKPPHEHWRPDFEFLLREDVMAKLFDRAQSAASSEHAA